MTKIYIAKTRLSLSVTLPSGHRKMIGFTPISSGGSRYTSNNKAEIEAIEKSVMFNDLFKVGETIEDDIIEQAKEDVDDETAVKDSAKGIEGELISNFDITNLPDAKAFLKEKGSKAVLSSKAAVLAEAKVLGYSFPNVK